jgi:hypothetical protein
MKRVLLFQVLTVVIGIVLLFICGAQQNISSYASGGFLVTTNFVLLGMGWKMVFQKKLIALSVLIIVFKYAILGIFIYLLVKQSWLNPFWFAAGVSSMVIASLIYGLTLGFYKEE